MEGTLRGLEAWGSVQATPSWRLHAGYLRLLQDLQLKPGSRDFFGSVATAMGANPGHQWLLRSALDLPRQTELDVTVRHVSALATPVVPAYTAVDLRWGWRPNANSELSATAQNLFDPGHGEFTSVTTRTEFGRALFVRWMTRF
jgi:iron complex outermembrane receptor protein